MKGNALKPFLIFLCLLAHHAAWIAWSNEFQVINDSLQLLILAGSLVLSGVGWLFLYQYAYEKTKNQEDKDDLQMIKYLFILVMVVQVLIYAVIGNYYLF